MLKNHIYIIIIIAAVAGFLALLWITWSRSGYTETNQTARGYIAMLYDITSRLKPFLGRFALYPYIVPLTRKKPVKSHIDTLKRNVAPGYTSRLYTKTAHAVRSCHVVFKTMSCGFKNHLWYKNFIPQYIVVGKSQKILGVCVILGDFRNTDRLTGEVFKYEKNFFKYFGG